MNDPSRWAVLDLETRFNVSLARAVLSLDPSLPDAEVRVRLAEKRREKGLSDFQKLPYHEPVACAVLLAEREGDGPDAPVKATEWRCWRAGDLPLEQFLLRFFDSLAGRTYVGFNSQNFDLPVMELWASKLLVHAGRHFEARSREESPRYRYASDQHLDLQKELVNFASGAGTLDELCKFHGLPGKPGVNGEDVEAMVEQGRLDEVHAYNVTDVLQTHLLLLHTMVRAGRLGRSAAAASVRSVIDLTREGLAARLPAGKAARLLLETTLAACELAPLARLHDR